MARYEVTARTRRSEHPGLALKARTLQTGMHLARVDALPDGSAAIVLQHRLRRGGPDREQLLTHRTLAALGIQAGAVERIDLHLLTRRRGRTLVRSWPGPGRPEGPGNAGDREPRHPLPSPPSLQAEADLP